MMNKMNLKTKIAQLVLAAALICSFNAEAASLDKVQFGENEGHMVLRSQTVKPANMMCLDDVHSIYVDAHVDPVLDTPVDMVKYAYEQGFLYQVEINFQKSDGQSFMTLMDKLDQKYGKGKLKDRFDKEGGTVEFTSTWAMADKVLCLSYMNNKGFAISTILYGLMILFIFLFLSLLGILSQQKNNIEKLIENTNGARYIVNGNKEECVTKDECPLN